MSKDSKITKKCEDCGLGYMKRWYQPMWSARKDWDETHSAFHNSQQWSNAVRFERERICDLINNLEEVSFEADAGLDFIAGDALDLIALIKGETK